jgi:hypothetical protein
MDGVGTFQELLGSLRETFTSRIPGGISEKADSRLQRTLNHYIKEVVRVQGTMNDQDILRLTYDSMANWYKRNTSQLSSPAEPAPMVHDPSVRLDGEEDPLVLFARIRAERDGAPAAAGPLPAPMRIAELEAIETRLPALREPVQPKDFIPKQQDVAKYREVEHNIVINSKDRDWLHSTEENRYRFSVQFNGGYKAQGTAPQPTIQSRLRNIVRIEFVKAILPVEGLDVVVPRDCSDGATIEKAFYSALALPYINVLLNEFEGNNIGTNDTIDKSLAICQYDATWRTDNYHSRTNTNRGYTLFFPKFMKAQRIYQPTPLANLQSLSFQVLGPENLLLSNSPDVAMIKRIAYSNDISGSCYQDTSGEYLLIETKKWFPLWAFSQLDRIKLEGYELQSTTSASAAEDFKRWLQREEGHIVVGLASSTVSPSDPSTWIQNAHNGCGYANWIVIRNRFTDPTGGACTLDPFAGALEADFRAEVAAYPDIYQRGGAMNLSRQVQMVLRVITREFDIASNVRPDNI